MECLSLAVCSAARLLLGPVPDLPIAAAGLVHTAAVHSALPRGHLPPTSRVAQRKPDSSANMLYQLTADR